MLITRGVKNGSWGSYRMMIIRGEKERYLESLQDDDHSWSKRIVPGILTG
jgi:hypothetical protein